MSTSNELVPFAQWDKGAKDLALQYAGFADAKDLTPEEQVQSVATLVPVALKIVDEARDTIERMNDEVTKLKIAAINDRGATTRWWHTSIPELDNLTPMQLLSREKTNELYEYAMEFFR